MFTIHKIHAPTGFDYRKRYANRIHIYKMNS
jgi:hypothetical protein